MVSNRLKCRNPKRATRKVSCFEVLEKTVITYCIFVNPIERRMICFVEKNNNCRDFFSHEFRTDGLALTIIVRMDSFSSCHTKCLTFIYSLIVLEKIMELSFG